MLQARVPVGVVRRNPANETRTALRRAARPVIERLEQRLLLVTVNFNGPTWIEQGPGPAINGALNAPPESTIVGATQVVIAPPNDVNVAFVGTVNGGVWMSRNANVAAPASPTWTLLTGPDLVGPITRPKAKEQVSQSIGGLALSHFDSSGNKITRTSGAITIDRYVIYAGFGNFSSGANHGGPLAGLIKSSDGGSSWQQIGESTLVSFKGQNIVSIVTGEDDADTVLVGTNGANGEGVYLSTNGGTTFKKVLPGFVTDLASDPGNPLRYYAGVVIPTTTPAKTGVYRSENGGKNWTPVGSSDFDVIKNNGVDDDHDGKKDNREDLAHARRVMLSVSPAGSGDDRSVYAALIHNLPDKKARTMGVYRSTDHGANWTLLKGLPNINPGEQGIRHFSMAGHPTLNDVVFVAGDNTTRTGNAGNVWRVDVDAGGTVTWTEVVHEGAGGTFPHPDSRDMTFDRDGNLLQADDGGIYRLITPDSSSRRWQSRGGNIRALEFWYASYDRFNQSIIGGTQDNGPVVQPAGGGLKWNTINQGDGIITHVDHTLANTTYRYFVNQNFRSFGVQKASVGSAPVRLFPRFEIENSPALGLTLVDTGSTGFLKRNGTAMFDNTLEFETQYALNATNNRTSKPNDLRMLVGSSYLYEVYFTADDTDMAWHAVSLGGLRKKGTKYGPKNPLGTVTAMAYGGMMGTTPAPEVAYVAAGTSLYVRTAISKKDGNGRAVGSLKENSFNDFVQRVSPTETIRDIVLDPADWHKGFLIDSAGEIYGFVNALADDVNDWRIHTGTLDRVMPVKDLRSVEYIPASVTGSKPILLVGGQGGVFATTELSGSDNTVWTRVGQRMPNVVVNDVRYDATSDTLIAATYGRGVWKIDNFRTRALAAAAAGSFSSEPVANSEIAPALVAGDPGVLELFGDQSADTNDIFKLVLDEQNPLLLNVFVNNATAEPDFTIEASAVQKVIVTAGAGNDTLVIDHANGLVSFPEPTDFDGETRQEVGQTPLDGTIVSRIRSGLDSLAAWSNKLLEIAELAEQLPEIGGSIAQSLAIGDGSDPVSGVLQSGLVDRVKEFLQADTTPTVQELVDLLKSLSRPLGNVRFGIDPISVAGGLFTTESGQQELRFDLAMNLGGFVGSLPLDLSKAFDPLNVSVSTSGTVDLTTSLNLDLSFGIDLRPNLSDSDAFFVRLKDASANARVSAGVVPIKIPVRDDLAQLRTGKPLNLDLDLGFLKAQVEDGSLELDAAVRVDLINPDSDAEGRITLAELNGYSAASLFDVEATGQLNVSLPLGLTLGGLPQDSQPVVRIVSEDIFDPALLEVTSEGFDDLFNFSNVSAESVVLMLRQLANSLGGLSDSSAFAVPIPLTSKTLGDALDLAGTATRKLTDPLVVPGTDQPNFSTADELADRFAVALGLDPSVINANYDSATDELTFRLSFLESYSPDTAAVDLGLDLSPLGEFSFSSDFDLNASAGADFTFGIYLGELAADQSTADRFFIEDAALAGSLSLAGTNMSAQAKIGMLGVGVTNGSAGLEASATIELQNPLAANAAVGFDLQPAAGPATPGPNRLPLPSFASLLLNDPASLIAPRRLDNLMPGVAVNISQQPGNQVEPIIVIDPSNPTRMFAASNGYKGGTMVASYSTDAGATWTSRLIGTGSAGDGFDPSGADPAAVFDKFGNLYFSYLTADHQKVPVLLSTDGGKTFLSQPIHTFATNGASIQPPLQDIGLDRPVLAAGPTGDPASSDTAVWLAFIDRGIGVEVVNLRVSGAGRENVGTFGSREKLVGTSQDNFPDIAVGPKGQVAVVVQGAAFDAPTDPSNINVFVDPDGLGSQTFGTKQFVAQTQLGPKEPIAAQPDRKINSAPSIGYAMAGPHVGELYVVYTEQSKTDTNDTDVVLKYSNKDGAAGSWTSTTTPVSHGPKGSSQFWPIMGIDPKTGNIAVAWYDTRHDTTDKKKADFYVAVSSDGGRSFGAETRLTTASSEEDRAQNVSGSSDPFDDLTDTDFGDYTAIDFFDGDLFPTWADNSIDQPNAVDRFDIHTAKVSLGKTTTTPSAPAFTSPLANGFAAAAATTSSSIAFTGYAHADLPIQIEPALIPLTDAKFVIDWSDLTNLSSLTVTPVNISSSIESLFASFENLTFDDILGALQNVVGYLKNLQGFGFLNQKLPLIDVSVSGLLDYAQKFADKIEELRANPAGSIQELQTLLDDTFGVPVTIALDASNNLKFQLEFESDVSTTRDLNFDLASLPGISAVPGLLDVVNISGAAGINASVQSLLNLALGIDLSDPLNPKPFLYDGDPTLGGTGFSLNAKLDALIADLTVSIGILSAKVTNGTASVHHKDFNNQPAHFGVSMTDDDGNGRHYFSENLIEDVAVDLKGAAEVELPLSISFPTPTTLTPNFKLTIPDLAAMFRGDANSVQFQTPDLSALIGDLDLLSNMSGLVEGLDQLLALLQTALDNKAFNRNLPLVGNHLKDGAQVIGKFREDIIARIKPLVDADKSVQGVRSALFSVLGPSDLNLLKDRTDDADQDVTIDDIEIVMDNPSSPDDVRFDFHLHKSKAPQTQGGNGLGFDIGLPALQLQATGAVDVEMGFDFAVGVGLNRQHGIYFDTSGFEELLLDFGVQVRNFSGAARLGFLQLDVTDDAADPTNFTGLFKVDLLDSTSDGDTKLAIGELTTAGISARLVADAEVNLDLKTSFGGAARFPSILSDFNLDWHFDSDTAAAAFGSAPSVSFENIRVNLGTLFNDFAGPVLHRVRELLDPLQPLIDVLETRVEALEALDSLKEYFDVDKDGVVTVQNIVEKLDPSPLFGFIDGAKALHRLASSIPAGSNSFELQLGRFDLNGVGDLRNLSNLESVTPINQNPRNDWAQQLANGGAGNFATALQDDDLGSAARLSGGKLEFPLFQNPATAFKLLLGQDSELFRWDTPTLEFDLEIDRDFHLLGPLEVTVSGGVGLRAHAVLGYDTSGLRKWRSSGNESDIVEGFFIEDRPAGSAEDPAEITASGRIGIGFGADILIADASVKGELVGTLALNLQDPDNDGKVRWSELSNGLAGGPLCIFEEDIGELAAVISVHASVGVWPFEASIDKDLVRVKLMEFRHECEADGAPSDPGLATDGGGGLLILNMGADFAKFRKIGNKTDGNEEFTVAPDPDVPGNILVSAFGFSQSYSGFTDIFASAGEGNDAVVIDPSLDVTAFLLGGNGHDILQAGAGRATLHGDAGDDQLTGGAENDLIRGLAGNDLLFGQGGDDTLQGGDDIDVIYGQGGNDTISGGAGIGHFLGGDGNDMITGGASADTMDGEAGDDNLIGNAGNDLFHGREGDDSISGGDGEDSLAGDAGNDTLDGGNHADSLYGGADEDSITAGDGNDTAFGDTGDDKISGGGLQDQLHGGDGNDTIAGDDDNDDVYGDAGNDSLDGGAANDLMVGGEGDDVMTGQAGIDHVSGSAGNDSMDGGAENDSLFGNEGNDTVAGGTGNDSIEGSFGSDSLAGNAGADTIFGQEDDDRITGGDDSDRLFGDAGKDTIAGETAADYIEGGADADSLSGDAGADRIFGNAGDDDIHGNGDDDTVGGGSGADVIFGDAGADSLAGDDDADLIFGDYGQVALAAASAIASFQSTSTGAADGGGNDSIAAGNGNDTALGGQRADTITGGEGDDDLIGGHNVAGGADGADAMDGGAGSDAIAGDNASIIQGADTLSARFRVLAGQTLYTATGAAAVTGESQADPAGAVARTITLLDHTATTSTESFGADSIAGGAGDDCVFGGLGNDIIQGDASVDVAVSATAPSVSSTTDGDDYIEGNGGSDLIFGNGGQDDIVGGSSSLFGLNSAAMRPDGADYLFGGSGTQAGRDHLGDTSATGHAYDSDFILGDNGIISRIVGMNGVAGTGFVTFNYDNYGSEKIIPRAVTLLDYTPGTGAVSDFGGADTAHGEAGDDAIYGAAGNDVLFGEGQDDDLIGGAGHDRLYGGTGEDGMLGDDGVILTSRNGLTEPLSGLTAANVETQITLQSGVTSVWSFITGRLFKTVDLAPFTSGGNDLMYGGRGDDFMHGGAGDDAMSGAEAQAQWYNDKPVDASFFSGLFTVADPTSPLGYNAATTKFAAYDASGRLTAMKKIQDFFLNFDAVDGAGAKILDGKDRLFGDDGNDWLVGGTQNDRAFGGSGNDVLNNDDNLDTNDGLNDQPDSSLFADADFAYGGSGRDALISNTGADRLYDWNGEFNSFYVPFGAFDNPTIVRRSSPSLITFLLALGRESGADRTLTEPDGELGLTEKGENGGPRDPQPGNNGGVTRDTIGGPEDDRVTALLASF